MFIFEEEFYAFYVLFRFIWHQINVQKWNYFEIWMNFHDFYNFTFIEKVSCAEKVLAPLHKN